MSHYLHINNAGVNDMFEFLSDFEVVSDSNGEVFAYVSCRSAGSLWLKPIRRLVLMNPGLAYFVFVDSGHHTPDLQAERMYRKHLAEIKAKKAGLIKE